MSCGQRKLTGILGALLGMTVIAACGSDTTTVVNNTTTVEAETTAETAGVVDGSCGDIASGELGAYNVVATAVDCDEALVVAEAWDKGRCFEESSSACEVGSYTCVRRFGDQGATVYCNEQPNDAAGFEFTFHEPGPGA